MRNLQEITNRASAVFWILLSVNAWATEDPKTVTLTGTPIFTFTNDHIVLQSEAYFYKISKQNLNEVILKKINHAVLHHSDITLNLSAQDISYAWPVNYQAEKVPQAKDKLVMQVQEFDNKMNFTGELLFSFADRFVFLMVDGTVYEIEKTRLSQSEQKNLNKHNYGDIVKLSVPKSAVQNNWSFKPQVQRQVASVPEPENVHVNKSYISIRGTIQYSSDDPSVIVQSQNNIYHLKRDAIVSRQPSSLNVVGSKVELIVPHNGVEFFWSLPDKN